MDNAKAAAALRALIDETKSLEQSGEASGGESHASWRLRVLSTVEEVFGPHSGYHTEFRAINWARPNTTYLGSETFVYPEQLKLARGILDAACAELERGGRAGGAVPTSTVARSTSEGDVDRRTVFIAFSEVEHKSATDLRDLLKNKLTLRPVLLSEQPRKGRTVIEALEEEAGNAGYTFVIMTPDDEVIDPNGQNYRQPRPNVIFEHGWLYAKLGRSKVCILLKDGTTWQSDIDGILHHKFKHSIRESFESVRDELEQAGVSS